MLIEGKTPMEFARDWYLADDIHRSINRRDGMTGVYPLKPDWEIPPWLVQS